MTGHELQAAIDAVDESKAQYLRDNGWQPTSQTPTFHWLWRTEWHGEVIMVDRDRAIAFQMEWERHGK